MIVVYSILIICVTAGYIAKLYFKNKKEENK